MKSVGGVDAQVSNDNVVEKGNNQDIKAKGSSIYIKGLPWNVTPRMLENEFKKIGPIKASGIQVHNQIGFCFAFVGFEMASSMQNVVVDPPNNHSFYSIVLVHWKHFVALMIFALEKPPDIFIGVGVLVTESYEHAMERKAPIIVEYLSRVVNCDSHHKTSTRAGDFGVSLYCERSFEDVGVSPEEINYINAHAISTFIGDLTEINTIIFYGG
ncbi:hypothetical protein V6N13_034295 [Hibiscus sabdariffa]